MVNHRWRLYIHLYSIYGRQRLTPDLTGTRESREVSKTWHPNPGNRGFVFRTAVDCSGCNAFEIRDSDSGARQDQRGPNDIFGVYDTAQERSASGSADQRALYACERGRFL
jgi:hypothetical protein